MVHFYLPGSHSQQNGSEGVHPPNDSPKAPTNDLKLKVTGYSIDPELVSQNLSRIGLSADNGMKTVRISYLPPPDKMPEPLSTVEEIVWPEGLMIPSALRSVITDLVVGGNDSPNLLYSNFGPSPNFTLITKKILIRNHLSSIVASLRSPKSGKPLEVKTFEDLLQFLQSCEISTDTPEDLINGLTDQDVGKKPSLERKAASFTLKCLERPESLGSPKSFGPLKINKIPMASSGLALLLELLACSQITERWLGYEGNCIESINIRNLQDHLAGIVFLLRTDEDSVGEAELVTLMQLIQRCNSTKIRAPAQLLRILCVLFQGTEEEFVTMYRCLFFQVYLEPNSLKYALTKPDELTSQIVDFETLRVCQPSILQDDPVVLLLLFLASGTAWDHVLSKPIIFEKTFKAVGESEEEFSIKRLEKLGNEFLAQILQGHLCALVHQIRMQSGSLDMEHIETVQFLLKLNAIDATSSETLFEDLCRVFLVDQEMVQSFKTAFKWAMIESKLLGQEELIPLDSRVITKGLPNLGTTCYMNVVLQLIAHMDFDSLLKGEISFIPPYRHSNEEDNEYQSRVVEERQKFEALFPMKLALQDQLRGVISQMRLSGKELGAQELQCLYSLLELNGWDKTICSQEDPHEFLKFLMHALGARGPELQVIDLYRYDKDGQEKSFQVPTVLNDLAFPIPTDGKRISSEVTSLEQLFKLYAYEDITGDNTCVPPEEVTQYALNKARCLVGEPPKNLFVQLIRSGFERGEPFRIAGEAPLKQTFKIPFHNGFNLSERPKEVTYAIKAVIGHRATIESYSQESFNHNAGHYSIVIQQLDELSASGILVNYDDNKPPQVFNCSALPPDAIQEMRSSAYYVAFERVAEGTVPVSWEMQSTTKPETPESEMTWTQFLSQLPKPVFPKGLSSKNARPMGIKQQTEIIGGYDLEKLKKDVDFSDEEPEPTLGPSSPISFHQQGQFPEPIDPDFIAWPSEVELSPFFKDFLKYLAENTLLDEVLSNQNLCTGPEFRNLLKAMIFKMRNYDELGCEELNKLYDFFLRERFSDESSAEELCELLLFLSIDQR